MVHAALLSALKLRETGIVKRSLGEADHFQCGGQVFRVTGSASMRRIQAPIPGPIQSAVTRPDLRLPVRSTNATSALAITTAARARRCSARLRSRAGGAWS